MSTQDPTTAEQAIMDILARGKHAPRRPSVFDRMDFAHGDIVEQLLQQDPSLDGEKLAEHILDGQLQESCHPCALPLTGDINCQEGRSSEATHATPPTVGLNARKG